MEYRFSLTLGIVVIILSAGLLLYTSFTTLPEASIAVSQEEDKNGNGIVDADEGVKLSTQSQITCTPPEIERDGRCCTDNDGDFECDAGQAQPRQQQQCLDGNGDGVCD